MLRLLKRILPSGLKQWTRRARGSAIAFLGQRLPLTREPLSHLFLKGHGIEIGALNWPLDLPKRATARYLDQASREELVARFPEFSSKLLPVDHVASIENLEGLDNESQDFVIANHVLEHSENPLQALSSMFRVLKRGGVLFLTLPDKRYTFDVERPITSYCHLLADFENGPEESRSAHYEEYGELVEGITDSEALSAYVAHKCESLEDIHFHVWTQADMLEMLVQVQRDLGLGFDILALSKTGLETIFVLEKHR